MSGDCTEYPQNEHCEMCTINEGDNAHYSDRSEELNHYGYNKQLIFIAL